MSSKSWLSTNYFLQFAVNGVFLPFWILYLTSVKNLSVLEASSIFSMLYLARFLSGIFLSPYLLKRFSMNLSLKIAVISGVILAASYGFTPLMLIYIAMSFVFSDLYKVTNRIVTPMIAHISMNGLVMFVQVMVHGSGM